MKSVRNFIVIALAIMVGAMVIGSVAAQESTEEAPQPGFLGVQLTEQDNQVVVLIVVPGSGAASAGVQHGDVIKSVNGTAVSSAQDVADAVSALNAGDKVTLDIDRSGTAMTLDITLGTRPQDDQGRNAPMERFLNRNGQGMPDMDMMPNIEGMLAQMLGKGHLGVTFIPLDADVAAQHNLTVTDGALITAVDANSPAATAGVQVDDVVTAVNNEPVDAEHTLFDRLFAYEPGDVVTLDVLRGSDTMKIEATLGESQYNGMGFMLPFFNGQGQGNGPGGRFHFQIPMPPGMGQGHSFRFGNEPPVTPEATPQESPNT